MTFKVPHLNLNSKKKQHGQGKSCKSGDVGKIYTVYYLTIDRKIYIYYLTFAEKIEPDKHFESVLFC